MYPTQLPYMQTAAPMYSYPANYCMLPAMYGSTLVPQQQKMMFDNGSPTMTSVSNVDVTNRSPVAGTDELSLVKDRSNSAVTVVSSSDSDNVTSDGADTTVAAIEDRSGYIEELSKEKETLNKKDNYHASRLLDQGNI